MGHMSRQVSRTSQRSFPRQPTSASSNVEAKPDARKASSCSNCGQAIAFRVKDTEFERMKKELALKNSLCDDLQQRLQEKERQEKISASQEHTTTNSSMDMVALIAEKYAGMFDNEWRRAYNFLDQTMNLREDKVLDSLQRILRAAYSYCNDVAKAQLINMEGEIYCPLSTWTEYAREDLMDHKVMPTPETSRLAQTYRQNASYECIPALQASFISHILPDFMEESLSQNECVLDFVNKCVEISWYMRVQEKPMMIVGKVPRKSPFDHNMFQYYTNSGDFYDFIVWPALLVHENGPVAVKGVAQALDSNRTRTQSQKIFERLSPIASVNQNNHASNQPKSSDLNTGIHGSTPWGDNLKFQRGTPSVDLPPLPDETVSPTRVDPSQRGKSGTYSRNNNPMLNIMRKDTPSVSEQVLTGTWKQ